MKRKAKSKTCRRLLQIALVVFLAFVALDYINYYARNRRAMTVVSDLGGSAGSLLGWPFGKEYHITFTRPLTATELERLAVLNSLAGRDHVAVAFNCDLTPKQLEAAKRRLSECYVFQPEARFREH